MDMENKEPFVLRDYFGKEITKKDRMFTVYKSGFMEETTGSVIIPMFEEDLYNSGEKSPYVHFKDEAIADDYVEYTRKQFSLEDIIFNSQTIYHNMKDNYFVTFIDTRWKR